MSELESEIKYLQTRVERLIDYTEKLEDELSDFQDLQLCDCCEGLFETCHDAEGHMQCERCTKLALREEEQALREIAYSRYCDYENTGSGQYGIGVTDGHRYCAKIAKAALRENEDAN